MSVNGFMYIAGASEAGTGVAFHGIEAEIGTAIPPEFRTADDGQTERALEAARAALPSTGGASPQDRAALLERIGQNILDLGDVLIERAMAETGLPRPRLEGERMRTIGQLRMFANMLRAGDSARIRIDAADADRAIGPKPDLRMMMVPLGPVVVFGASNFPLAFSVAGGDTASALAAGCPVIVKGHPAHPGTAELVAEAVTRAVAEAGFHPGTFSFLHDAGIDVGKKLVSDARVKAVGFTGSRHAGLALVELAAQRPEPIPVYAEMSAINPVVLLPHRLAEAAEAIAAQFVASLTLGSGQFCTNPGLVLAVGAPECDRFIATVSSLIADRNGAVMLSPGIEAHYRTGASKMAARPNVKRIAAGKEEALRSTTQIFTTDATTFLADRALHEEMFGPAALVVVCADNAQLIDVLEAVEGQLTVSIHMSVEDFDLARKLLPVAMTKAGRILANGFGTGVEVSPAMVHGGPFPATSDGRTTSVGTLAIERFQRPVCLQDIPDTLLPPAVQEENPWNEVHRS